jgi:hydroxyacylglutathione hydrolase
MMAMKIDQIYTGCLAQGAYYIESEGEAIIIDPLREVQPYIDKATAAGAKIKYILETHFHADFVSGHLTLAEKTGATIVYGPTAEPTFKVKVAADGEELHLGAITIKVLHTPGHTMESTTYLVRDEQGKDHAIFTGDTLFLGDVGRPDLAQKAATLTQEQLAAMLFNSLRNKIMPLGDDLIVYPGHGAGSACGKNMMKETVDSLGNQKRVNYALRADMTEQEFVQELTEGLLAPPSYFPANVKLNKEGYTSIDELLKRGTVALNPMEFKTYVEENQAIILDVRHEDDFVKAHIPTSVFIGIEGNFAPWVGAMIGDVNQAILLITPPGKEEETITRLARVGFDKVLGYLKGGLSAWQSAGMEVDSIESISAKASKEALTVDSKLIIDVRKVGEFKAEHVVDAINIPLGDINLSMDEFPENETFYLHCKGGYRSVIAASILKSRGIHNLINIEGGFDVIKTEGFKTTNFVCPTTLKDEA